MTYQSCLIFFIVDNHLIFNTFD